MKRLFVFDLDGTLAPSKSAIDDEVAAFVGNLLEVMQVAVISGGDWSQFETQLLANLPTTANVAKLVLLPTCGTQFFRYDGRWQKLYSEDLSADEKRRIIDALNTALDQSGLRPSTSWGPLIEDRGSQVTLSALGQEAPLSEKKGWDPDFAKRRRIAAILEPLLGDFAVRFGGTTSIDVTKPGIDKAYGIGKLREVLGIELDEMLFAGDALFPGGNDYPVKECGVDSVLVRDPLETSHVIQAVIACQKELLTDPTAKALS